MRKKLTRQEYKEKFTRLFSSYNYILQCVNGITEKIVQCHAPYPDYWFISNMGYLFSVSGNKLKIVKPNYRRTGKKMQGQSWFYKIGSNTPPIPMQKIIAEHFFSNEFEPHSYASEIHHKKPVLSFGESEPQKANRVTNLQLLPKYIHAMVTRYSKKSITGNISEFVNECEKSPLMIYFSKPPLENVHVYITHDNGYVIILTLDSDGNVLESEAQIMLDSQAA